jgi:hypothetical protein
MKDIERDFHQKSLFCIHNKIFKAFFSSFFFELNSFESRKISI